METRICTKCNKEKLLIEFYFRKDTQRYMTICKECNKNKSKEYYKKHKEYYDEYNKMYRINNSEYFKKYQKTHSRKYYNKYIEERRKTQREYYYKNSEKVKEYNKHYNKNKKQNDILFKKTKYISNKIRQVFNEKGNKNRYSVEKITKLNCKDLYNYLLKTFENNYGRKWCGEDIHIDHIKPLALIKKEEDIIKLNHYTNLQLLLPKDNMKKWKHI